MFIKTSNLILLINIFSFLNCVQAHGVEVRHCLTTEGKLRIFVEHWHNDFIESIAEAGTADFAIEQLNVINEVDAIAPTGIINDVNVYNGDLLPGCVGTGNPPIDSFCVNQTAYYDWAYFDFTFSCEVPSSYTILKGNSNILERGCKEVYPVTVIPALSYCPDAPSTSPSMSPAPSIKKEPTKCFDVNNPDAFPKEVCNTFTTRSFCENSKCVWFNSMQYCGTCEDLTAKNFCNSQQYCEWFKEQPSASPSASPAPSVSPPTGACEPDDPLTALPTSSCRLNTDRPSCQTDGCVWFNSNKVCGTCDEIPGKNWCFKKGCVWKKFD